jgi:hypothetical protein
MVKIGRERPLRWRSFPIALVCSGSLVFLIDLLVLNNTLLEHGSNRLAAIHIAYLCHSCFVLSNYFPPRSEIEGLKRLGFASISNRHFQNPEFILSLRFHSGLSFLSKRPSL